VEATFIFSDPNGPIMNTSLFRIVEPAGELRMASHTINTIAGGTLVAGGPHAEEADLIDYSQITETVLVEREISPDIVRKLRYAGAKRVVLTYDDHYGRMPDWAPRKKYWLTPDRYRNWVEAHAMVDAVMVAGPKLMNIVRPSAPYYYVPNYLDPKRWFPKERYPTWRSVLGWGGSKEHKASWDRSPLLDALKNISKHPRVPTVRVANRVADPFLFDAGVPFQALDWQAPLGWANTVRAFDIGLAPLRGEYDLYRSHLKVLEYAAAGVPWVASDQAPYAGCQGGILVQTGKREAEHWENAIRILLEDDKFYYELAQRGKIWAQQFMLPQCVPLYEEILWPTQKSK
jgi:glycosyltransferase involved in cell wall biosynthesis